MDSSRIQTLPAQNDTKFEQARYLPTYEESSIPYSLRLPSYRSSYVRRFHPYARYATASLEEQYIDDYDHGDEESLLDLSILNASAPRTAPESVVASLDGRIAQHNQGRIEEHLDGQGEVVSESVIINLDVVNAHLNMQEDEEENADYSRQPPFLRMDVAEPCFKNL